MSHASHKSDVCTDAGEDLDGSSAVTPFSVFYSIRIPRRFLRQADGRVPALATVAGNSTSYLCLRRYPPGQISVLANAGYIAGLKNREMNQIKKRYYVQLFDGKESVCCFPSDAFLVSSCYPNKTTRQCEVNLKDQRRQENLVAKGCGNYQACCVVWNQLVR